MHGLRQTYHRLGKLFWTHPMVLLGDVGQRKRILVRLDIVLMSTQDRCMVCDESTIGMEITLGTPPGTPR
jgi:hypothetical protein